jgi:hypothetical protein
MSTPFIQRHGLHRVDTDLLLQKGSLAGPYRRTHPITLTLRMRFVRWVRSLIAARSPL